MHLFLSPPSFLSPHNPFIIHPRGNTLLCNPHISSDPWLRKTHPLAAPDAAGEERRPTRSTDVLPGLGHVTSACYHLPATAPTCLDGKGQPVPRLPGTRGAAARAGSCRAPRHPASLPTSLALSATRAGTERVAAGISAAEVRDPALPSPGLREPVLGADPVTSLRIKGGWDWGSKSQPGAHQPGSKSESSPCPLYYHIHSMKL